MDIRAKIHSQLSPVVDPKQFAKVMWDIGFNLMDKGELDSDEVIWEVAEEIWKDRDANFKNKVNEEFDKLIEAESEH